MSREVIGYYSRRYIVEVGSHNTILPNRSITEWEFHRGFDSVADAEAYASMIAEDHPHVRVVDRGERDDG